MKSRRVGLVVVTVLAFAFLAFLLKVGLSIPKEEIAKMKVAKSETELLAQALKSFKAERGYFPEPNSWFLILQEHSSANGVFSGFQVQGNAPYDPWGHEYDYTLSKDGKDFWVTSYGSDGKPGGKAESVDVVASSL